ncbi:MAG: DUF393 domain-containing protein [Pseudomonadota bacterium]
MSEIRVIYNDTCPICSREVDLYRREADAIGAPIAFSGLTPEALAATGMTRDEAARQFHVIKDGERIAGLDAFFVLWRHLPRWALLARLLDRPVIRPLARFAYDRIAAPALYAMDRRRQRRRPPATE